MVPAKNRSCLSWSPRHPPLQSYQLVPVVNSEVLHVGSNSDNFPRGYGQSNLRNTSAIFTSQRVTNHKNKLFHVYQTLPMTVFSCPHSNLMRRLLLFPFVWGGFGAMLAT